MKLSNKIKLCRKKSGMTQQQFADRLNVSRKTVSGWENNRSFPDIATLIDISNKFNISLDQLLKDSDNAINYYQLEIKNGIKNKIEVMFVYFSLLVFLIISYIQFLSIYKFPFHLVSIGLTLSLIIYIFIYSEWFKFNTLKRILIFIITLMAFFTINLFIFGISSNLDNIHDSYNVLGTILGSSILNFIISLSACVLLYCYPFDLLRGLKKLMHF